MHRMKLFLMMVSFVALPACDHEPTAARDFAPPPVSPPVAVDYPELLTRLAAKRRELENDRRQHNESEKLVAAARLLYCQIFAELAGQWMGTPWDFNGTTQMPRTSKIACGYFVTTLLRDAGFDVERAKLGQQASEIIARTMTTREFMRARSEEPLGTFVDACRKHLPGVYLVGLDFHTGYLVNDGTHLWFVHAAYGRDAQHVLVEKAAESTYLLNSKYRHVAFLTEDPKFLLGWLAGKKWVTAK